MSPLREFKGPTWEIPPASLELQDQHLHLWRASLDLPSGDLASMVPILSPDEVHRAERFVAPHLGNRFIASRAILRRLIGLYTGEPPDQIRFVTGPHGKPALDPAVRGERLAFNLAHSRGMAVYGFGRGLEIGVDLEQVRPDRDCEGLAARFYTSGEWEALQRLPQEERTYAFFTLWTCKEAVVKALGESLFSRLSEIEIMLPSPPPHPPTLSVSVRGSTQPWQVHLFEPSPGYCGAVAVQALPVQTSFWQWPG